MWGRTKIVLSTPVSLKSTVSSKLYQTKLLTIYPSLGQISAITLKAHLCYQRQGISVRLPLYYERLPQILSRQH